MADLEIGPEAGEPRETTPPAPQDAAPASPTPREPAAAGEPPTADQTPAPEPEPAVTFEPPTPAPPVPARRPWFAEPADTPVQVPRSRLAAQSRRDFLVFGAAVAATALGAWWLLPDRTRARLLPPGAHDRLDTLAGRVGLTRARRERLLDRTLTFDDDVAEALYSKDRSVRTYDRSQIEPLRNNYGGLTPGPEILPGWRLALSGLASGRDQSLTADDLARLPQHEQVTRLVCVEGWSAIAWWGGVRFAELLRAFPPAPGARWAALRSDVSMDAHGRPDPYYVSIDLDTARHPQTLLATAYTGRPLTLAHGAPLRLLAPMKLGLKNIKAITSIAYTAKEPRDYWNDRGYSRYDGL